jgi:hypothetical protein
LHKARQHMRGGEIAVGMHHFLWHDWADADFSGEDNTYVKGVYSIGCSAGNGSMAYA